MKAEQIAKKAADILALFYFEKGVRACSYFGRLVFSSVQKRKLKKTGSEFYVNPPFYVKGPEYITVGDKFACGRRVRIEAWDVYENDNFHPSIEIGEQVTIGNDCHIAAINRISIGSGSLLGSKVLITDHYHGNITCEDLKTAPVKRRLYSKGEVVIGENVWIGENVAIMPGVVIGKNTIIGANAVVTRDIPPNSVAAGAPAKVCKTLEK